MTNFMEFDAILEKCKLHMVANDQVQVVRNMSHRS